MIILIGGDTHTGKTYLASRLVKATGFACLSLDHLKMGLIRGLPHCPFTATDTDAHITRHLWPVVEGVIRTCIENEQHHILEGCYLPPEKVSLLQAQYPGQIVAVYLGFTPGYIDTHFAEIAAHEDIIEKRLYSLTSQDASEMKYANAALQQSCTWYGLPFFAAEQDYATQVQEAALQYILKSI